ncbi:MAG: ABC-type Fe3+-hydroxamate transport system periplasmic component-like protein [Desertimonas sp.]|nr:ABC-type Fe3+-hydroxamate transport system periplasmic component-like protein [Desertimonas sp.]
MYPRALVLGTAVVAVLVSSAASATTEPPTTAPANDTFTVQHAENFTLTYDDDYKVLTIGAGNTAETFVLVQRGAEPPVLDGELAGASVIEVPVEAMFSESSSHYGFIDVLDIEEVVTGVGDTALVVTPELAERAASGQIESFAPSFIVDPEGRANELYAEWLADYDAAAALAEEVTERPTAITGGLFEGTWYANGGASVVAQFIADGGGDYVYADDSSPGSIELDIETVLADGADADVWLLPQGFTTMEQAVTLDDRLDEFAAWAGGGVWTYEVALDPTVSFLESGPVMIDEYLLDYVAALHPDLVPDHEFTFLSEVPPS